MTRYYRPGGVGKFSMLPPVIKTLIVINLAVYVFEHFLLGSFTIEGTTVSDWFFYYMALWPVDGNFLPWQLLSYQFMHANIWHIFFNLFALWMFGVELEGRMGSRRFLTFYLICGIGAGLVQLFISPMFTATAPTIGASGSVYGILLAFGLTYPERPIFMFPFFIPIKAKFFVLIFAGMSLVMGFSASDGVAHFAHLGGALTGFLLMKFGDRMGLYDFIDKLASKAKETTASYNKVEKGEEAKVYKANWQYREEPKPTQEVKTSGMNIDGEQITQDKIDEILDKISAGGYQNLTDKEKKILFELSQKLK